MARAASSTAGTNQAETWSARRCIGDRGALGVLDQADDLGQGAVGADGGGADDEGAGAVEGGADDGVADGLVDRGALAGEHRLVDGRGALDDDAVDGEVLAGADPDEVADGDLVERDVDLGAVAQHAGGLRGEPDQGLDGRGGALLGLSSSQRPIRTRATTTSAVSKYRCSGSPQDWACPGHRVTNAL